MSQSLGLFLLEVAVISASGVMAPGPMTTVTIARGRRTPHAGALMTLGHGCIELPLILLILAGLGCTLDNELVRATLTFAGAAVLLYMGAGMLRARADADACGDARSAARSTTLAGALVSAINPYFILWWLTVGATLVFRAAEFGVIGFALFAAVHLGCDLAWCWFLSGCSFVGQSLLGARSRRVVMIACGAALLLFGAKFVIDGVRIARPGRTSAAAEAPLSPDAPRRA
jgi:threonine/homoserine/homoserine lactone efflux protein